MQRVFSYVAPRAALAGTLLFAAACTTSLKVGMDGTGGQASSSSATTSTTSTSTNATTSSSGAGGSTGNSGGSSGIGGAGGGCSGAIITVDGDGAARHYDFACKASYGILYTMDANGHFGVPGPHLGPTSVDVDGCATAGADPLLGSIELAAPVAMAGTSTVGTVTYDDGTDTYANSGTATVTVLTDTSGTISGTYSAAVQPTNGNGVKNISGSFKVCHVSDFFPP